MLKNSAGAILSLLEKEYPAATTALLHKNVLQLLVATILSAQCTDKRVNIVTGPLFKRYKTAGDFARAKQADLEKQIRSTGFYRSKARSILGAAKMILDDFGGKVPDSMEELIKLPGVARKTANIVLSYGFGKTEGIAVDTHVKRLSFRLGLTRNTDPVKIERDLMNKVAKKDWSKVNTLLVAHGRAICKAGRPLCLECVLGSICPSKKMFYTK